MSDHSLWDRTRRERTRRSRTEGRRRARNEDRLDLLIEDATIDTYNESEQRTGFHAALADHVQLPFERTNSFSGSP